MATPRLVELIDRYKSAHGVSEAELARRIGVTRENLRKWRTNGVRRLPERANLVAVARVIGRAYRDVLYDFQVPSLDIWLQLVAWSALSLLVGSLVFRRMARNIVEEI